MPHKDPEVKRQKDRKRIAAKRALSSERAYAEALAYHTEQVADPTAMEPWMTAEQMQAWARERLAMPRLEDLARDLPRHEWVLMLPSLDDRAMQAPRNGARSGRHRGNHVRRGLRSFAPHLSRTCSAAGTGSGQVDEYCAEDVCGARQAVWMRSVRQVWLGCHSDTVRRSSGLYGCKGWTRRPTW